MKRVWIILMVITLLMSTGCTMPFSTKQGQKDLTGTAGQTMLKAQEYTGAAITSAAITSAAITSAAITSAAVSEALSGAAVTTDGTTVDGLIAETTGNLLAADSDTPESSVEAVWTGSDDAGQAAGQTGVEGKQPVTVYYQDADGCLIPMTRWITRQQGIARAAVSLTIDSPMNREEIAYYGVYPVLPAGTEILGLDIRDGIAVIDFSSHLLDYQNAASEKVIVDAIVYTLTEFKTVRKVCVLINGYPQGTLKYGTDISGYLDRNKIAMNTDASILSGGIEKVDVFLTKSANIGFTYMVPVSSAVSEMISENSSVTSSVTFSGTTEAVSDELVRQLLKESDSRGMISEIPEGVKLLGGTVANGILTLDLSGAFLNYGGTEREEAILKQLAYTVRQEAGVKKLRLLIGGAEALLPEGTDISAGITIPATINDVMDR